MQQLTRNHRPDPKKRRVPERSKERRGSGDTLKETTGDIYKKEEKKVPRVRGKKASF